MSEFQQELFPGCILTNGNGSELEEINQVLHMLVLGQHSFSSCFLFFLQCSLISALPFVVTSSYRFQSAGKRCFNTHSQSPFCVILMTIYAKKAHHDEGEPQPTNCGFGPWGSRSDWTIATVSQSESMGARRRVIKRKHTVPGPVMFPLSLEKMSTLFPVGHKSLLLHPWPSLLNIFSQFISVSLAFAYLAPSSSPHRLHQITVCSLSHQGLYGFKP